MPMQARERYLPDSNRVGVLTATVLLTYALTRLINAPGITVSIQLPGFYFAYPLTLGTAMTLMAAGLTASGMDWLLRNHPSMDSLPSSKITVVPTYTRALAAAGPDRFHHRRAARYPALRAAVVGGIYRWRGAAYRRVRRRIYCSRPGCATLSAGFCRFDRPFLCALPHIRHRLADRRGALVRDRPGGFPGRRVGDVTHTAFAPERPWEFVWSFGIGLICAQLSAGLHYWPLMPLCSLG